MPNAANSAAEPLAASAPFARDQVRSRGTIVGR